MIARVLVPGRLFPRLSSAVTLLRSQGRNVLVDTGAANVDGRLLEALDREGLTPANIDTIVGTHLHYDHCGNHLLFPRARYVVSRSDYEDTRDFIRFYHADRSPGKQDTGELLRSHNETIKEFYVRSIVREVTRNLDFYDALLADDPRFLPVAGGTWLTDDIEVFPTPGHTPGHLSVLAHHTRLANGTSPVDVLIAGDALATQRTLENGGDSGLELAADGALYRRTRQHLLHRFRYIVPGHGVLTDNFPALAALPSSARPAAPCLFADVGAR